MVPRSLRRQLNRLRRRERLLRLTWAAARCLTVFCVVLAAACLIDFVVDLYRDTPRGLRLGLLGVHAALWLAGALFVLRFLVQRFSDTEVALWIEDRMPQLGHRLISAVQLNRPGAATTGMSPQMIAAVTRQAEEQAAAADFAQVADARRLKWSAQLLAPLVLGVLLLLVLCPNTLHALLVRQLLDDRPIPRSLAIASVRAHQVWPAGEEGVLRFRVRGAFAAHLRGEVRLDLPDGDKERHELIFESQDESGATFLARVPPLARDFTYRAWLKDGRTHDAAEVHFEPRPIVRRQQAWVQLPSYIGVKPSGQPYEEPQKGADITYRLAGSTARVAIETQKPIVKATVEVLGPPHAFAEPIKPGARAETVRRSVDLAVRGDGCTAEGVFSFDPGIRPELLSTLAVGFGAGGPVSLPWAGLALAARGESMQTETAYRIVVRDEFGLENTDKPRRGIRTAPVDPPEVALLPETLSPRNATPTEDDEIEGIPILLGQRVPIDYECKAVYGLSHACLRYRVIPRTSSREDEGEPTDSEFLPLPLGAPRGQTGKASKKALEEFFAPPSDDPDTLGGTEGGGRYDFDSAGIPDGKGGLLRLQEGDRIQFYVEVFGRADPDGVPGRSALREKEIVNQKDFWAWIEKKEDHKERIRKLEENQRALAGVTSLLPEERPHFSPDRPILPQQPISTTPQSSLDLGRDWQLIGPFANDKDAGHDYAYPPETEATDLKKEQDGLNGKVRWQLHHSLSDKIDLQKVFDHGEAGVAYAVCWIKPSWRMHAILATGSDDGIKVWINRKLVLDKPVHREAIPADDKTPIILDTGWQEILVKIDNRFGTWAFYFDLLDPGTGKPLPRGRFQVRTTPLTIVEGKAFVKSWLMLGPFGDGKPGGHAKVFPPERDPVDLKREYEVRKGKARWKPYHGKEGIIGLNDVFSLKPEQAGGAVAYAVCWVRSDKDRLAILATGSDDGIKVWINRRLALDKAVQRATEPSSERTPVRLKAGWNEVLVKIDNVFGYWSYCLELLDPPSGKELPNVQYRITPPEKKR
ncbi:MAG TPA: hypothetical protein VMG10_28975 [Gemmataceae bacterium]|nr:hypothetical protein [Gemmataceae bacterium]